MDTRIPPQHQPRDPHMSKLLSSLDIERERREAGPYAPISIALDDAVNEAIEVMQTVARTKTGAHGMPIPRHIERPLLLDMITELQILGWRKL